MISETELADLAERLHLPTESVQLSHDRPLSFTVQERFLTTLEYNAAEQLIVSVQAQVPEYAQGMVQTLLQECSVLHTGFMTEQDMFSTGMVQDRVMLLHCCEEPVRGAQLYDIILQLCGRLDEALRAQG